MNDRAHLPINVQQPACSVEPEYFFVVECLNKAFTGLAERVILETMAVDQVVVNGLVPTPEILSAFRIQALEITNQGSYSCLFVSYRNGWRLLLGYDVCCWILS